MPHTRGFTVIPALSVTVIPGRPYRHSRVSGNPERYCLMMPHTRALSTVTPGRPYRHSRVSGNPTVACRQCHPKSVPFGIPAYAGMTVGGVEYPIIKSGGQFYNRLGR